MPLRSGTSTVFSKESLRRLPFCCSANVFVVQYQGFPPCVESAHVLYVTFYDDVRKALAVLTPQAVSVSNAACSFDRSSESAEAGTCLQ